MLFVRFSLNFSQMKYLRYVLINWNILLSPFEGFSKTKEYNP